MTPYMRLLKIKPASVFLGVFLSLLIPACGENKTTGKWEKDSEETKISQVETSEAEIIPAAKDEDSKEAAAGKAEENKEVRFLAYNLKNYLTMKRYIDGKSADSPKPEEEIAAIVNIIKKANPDIIGLSEIGNDKDLKDLYERLKKAGIDLQHAHLIQGSDSVRSLAVLSRYPILSTAIPKEIGYTLEDRPFKIGRGILDTTIQLPNRKVRFLGVHLKSKRPVNSADQAQMRRNEALLMRKHLDDIMTTSPETEILAYGDFNDTKRSRAVYCVRGRTNNPMRLEMIELVDSRGENWTHNWKREDIYSRIDFVMVNLNLSPHINREASRLLDYENWELASDHRPMLVLIK